MNTEIFYQIHCTKNGAQIIAPFELPNRIYLEFFLERKDIVSILDILQHHTSFLEMVSKYERHIKIPNFTLYDRIEFINDLAFVLVSDSEYIVKFMDEPIDYMPKDMDKRYYLNNHISMKTWAFGPGLLFQSQAYYYLFTIFYAENSKRFQNLIELKNSTLKISFTNSAEMVILVRLFFTFILCSYQVWKLFMFVDSRRKRFETLQQQHQLDPRDPRRTDNFTYESKEIRRMYVTAEGKNTVFRGESAYMSFRPELNPDTNTYNIRTSRKFIS